MAKTTGRTPDYIRDFSFKDWFSRFSNGIESQSNEKIYKQTFYNVIGTSLMLIFSVALWGVFMILQPFLKPLLWALLCGSVLHPFKNQLSKKLRDWIDLLNRPSITHIIVDAICFPILFLNNTTDSFLNFVKNHFYIVATILSIVSLHIIIPQFSVAVLWKLYRSIFSYLFLVQKLCSTFLVVITIVGGFLWLVLFRWSSKNKIWLSFLSTFAWFAVLCYITSFLDILETPSFLILVTLFISGFVREFLQPNEDVNESLNKFNKNKTNPSSTTSIKSVCETTNESNYIKKNISQRRKFTSQISFISIINDTSNERHTGDQYLYWLGCGCAFLFFIKWWWTPYVMGLQLILFILKKLYDYVGIRKFMKDTFTKYKTILSLQVDKEKINVIFPAAFINIYKILLISKTRLLKMLQESCDTISTISVILLVIVFIVVASMFLIMQVYTEGMYLVKVGSKVLNDTLIFNEHLNRIFPENLQNQLDSAFENAYMYGRDFISKMVRKSLDGMSEDKIIEIEKMILELWFRVCQAWINNDDNVIGPKVSPDAVYQIWDSFTLNIQRTSELMNMNTIMQFINNNMTTFSSAIKNVWDFTIDNVGLILYFLETLISIVLVSGFTVFSFFIDLIIFLTALFYLLSSSSNMYKPVEFITKVSPTYGNKLAVAIERSVSEVFMVSSKLSLFYGLYTWFLHNLFQMHIVYVPTVIAAILAAVPVLPTYIVCIPGILDLWLLQENSACAFLLFLLQFAPTNVVDVAIYEDIHGGHPYLNGLAMAGGVLYFGIEGAIIGPLILCFMLVIINFGASLMQEQINSSSTLLDD